ncbi:uncharacterized protein LOC126890213 [Diabrotica virgifera virgifera]|uniref:Uncharacterized protein n=1 Tax=Diabrotica virgifera virgifera TaxID=50390 RepID=A0ABM5KXV7_DIAVI|nr:uncharacterized protein LOC126890213 [Diabrotica virgifera virgifera]
MLENDNYKLHGDLTVLTDQAVAQNRPDLIPVNKLTRQRTLIEVAIPNNNNLHVRHNEKIARYRDLEIQIRRQWRMESTQKITIILPTTGVIPKNLIENIKKQCLNKHLYKKKMNNHFQARRSL